MQCQYSVRTRRSRRRQPNPPSPLVKIPTSLELSDPLRTGICRQTTARCVVVIACHFVYYGQVITVPMYCMLTVSQSAARHRWGQTRRVIELMQGTRTLEPRPLPPIDFGLHSALLLLRKVRYLARLNRYGALAIACSTRNLATTVPCAAFIIATASHHD